MPEPPKEYISNEKQELFWAAGFAPEFRKNLLVNDNKRLVVSFEFACKKSIEEIKKVTKAPRKAFGKWTWFFLEEPSKKVKKRIIEELWR